MKKIDTLLPLSEMDAFEREINQEDLLVEVSERIRLEMEAFDIDEAEFSKLLGKPEHYITGLLEGFANISLRELADVFSVFGKLLAVMPVYRSETVCKIPVSSTVPGISFKADTSVTVNGNVFVALQQQHSIKPIAQVKITMSEKKYFQSVVPINNHLESACQYEPISSLHKAYCHG